MAPTVSRSSSQSKISHSFKASAKTSKTLKQTATATPVPVAKPAPSPTLTEEKDEKHLVPDDPKFVSAARSIQDDRKAPFVHPESQNTIHTILRNFDLSPKYGPCVGMTRLDRYRRAEKMGLNPPVEVLQILETEEGLRDWNTDLFSPNSAV